MIAPLARKAATLLVGLAGGNRCVVLDRTVTLMELEKERV